MYKSSFEWKHSQQIPFSREFCHIWLYISTWNEIEKEVLFVEKVLRPKLFINTRNFNEFSGQWKRKPKKDRSRTKVNRYKLWAISMSFPKSSNKKLIYFEAFAFTLSLSLAPFGAWKKFSVLKLENYDKHE